MLIIGIDPGGSGGVAWIRDGMQEPLAAKMPLTPKDFVDLLGQVCEPEDDHIKVLIERVGPMPKQGVVSVWTFANTFWGPQWALAAMGLGYDLVRPQVWQKALSCMTGGDKNVSKAKAQQLWPNTKWIHATADAALICEYGRRMELRGQA
jgi:crossover junction endodeoxyribonuclease RuvC